MVHISFLFHPFNHFHNPHELFTSWFPCWSCILCRTVWCCCPRWYFSCLCITCRWNRYTFFNIHFNQFHLHPCRWSSHLLFHPCRCRPGYQISCLTWQCKGKYSQFLTLGDLSSPNIHPWSWVIVQNLVMVIFRSHLLGSVPYCFFLDLYWVALPISPVPPKTFFLCGFSFPW